MRTQKLSIGAKIFFLVIVLAFSFFAFFMVYSTRKPDPLTFEIETKNTFLDACIQPESGLTSPVCTCTYDRIISSHTYEQVRVWVTGYKEQLFTQTEERQLLVPQDIAVATQECLSPHRGTLTVPTIPSTTTPPATDSYGRPIIVQVPITPQR